MLINIVFPSGEPETLSHRSPCPSLPHTPFDYMLCAGAWRKRVSNAHCARQALQNRLGQMITRVRARITRKPYKTNGKLWFSNYLKENLKITL